MALFCWLLAALLGYGALVAVSSIGKSRKPVSHRTAVAVVVLAACEVTGLALVATGVLR
ncbi:hypothetical protein ABT275_03605 [Streptomyces sp. NPDC001185]|uniref:hypothetical protein n=1 Tax=Streptomyces sp. NPDC001185 TaxID=3154380 RepID=UPI00332BFE9E